MTKSFLQHIIVSLVILAVTGCQDDFMREETIGEGKASISATLDFKPMSSALSRSRTAGDALKEICSLHVLLYDDAMALIKSWEIKEYSVSDEKRNNGDAENGDSAEEETKRATFTLPERIDFGKYYMYAVANIPDLLTNTDYSEAIKTVTGLKNIPLTWDSGTVANNGQMIGCLMTRTATLPIDDEPLVLNESSTKLHAWLRRAASKVTVAFDGSSLKDGVSIYLKALRIKNIPLTCKLGADNTVESKDNLIETGEEVVYSESSSYDASYPALITKDLPCYPRVQETSEDGTVSWVMDPDVHSETNTNSLFFYENKQGKGPDKTQKDENKVETETGVEIGDGILDELYPYTDKPYATYIEVDAYYESNDPVRPGICNITYRFMLGQDITTDYNANRNCHYRLTLHFNGYADDPDWRIDYVTRLWVTQPETVDYRGMYFVPDNESPNQGNNFSADNVITVTSFMYKNDDWFTRNPQPYKIEYRDNGSTEFTETPPSWLGGFETTDKGNGIYKLKVKYKNPYTEEKINDVLSSNPSKENYDLSTKGGTESMNTANCYIVDSKGTYQFPLVYGNAITNGVTNAVSYTYRGWGGTYGDYLKIFKNYKNEDITKPYILDDIYGDNVPNGLSASLVWQDEPNLVTKIDYDPNAYSGKGGISFIVGDGIREGNAVIALKDPSGRTMWSWHIWVTAMDFSRKIIINRPYSKSESVEIQARDFEIMPVNLGWCSGGIPVRYYDRHECEVRFTQLISGDGQKGLSKTVKIIQEPHIALPRGNNPYFQWGRKDPFIAGGAANETTKDWYDADGNQKSSNPELMYTGADDTRVPTHEATAALIQNPDKWQNGPRKSPGDWGNKYKPDDTIYLNLWDNSCWDNNDDVDKTIYDPCPVGYHVSSAYTFCGFTNAGENIGLNSDAQEMREISDNMYAAIEDNMMPAKKGDGTDDEEYKNYRDGIFEFYTNRTKLISLGFPTNGYRDWDDDAKLLKYDRGEGQIWHAQALVWDWNTGTTAIAFHFEYNRTFPHIWPRNTFYATDGFTVRPTKTL